MPQTPIEKAALAIARVHEALKGLGELTSETEAIRDTIRSINTGFDHCPPGHDIEDIPETPFQVVFRDARFLIEPEFHAIVLRGEDVSEWVSDDLSRKALAVVEDAMSRDERDAEDCRMMAHLGK